MIRMISHTEVSTALDCFAKHAFGYTGALTDGTALVSRRTSPLLRDGKAWGAGVAAWHGNGRADAAVIASLQGDRDEQIAAGVAGDEAELAAAIGRLTRMLDHYTRHSSRLKLVEAEREIVVPLPSRRSNRASTRYRLRCFLDGVHLDEFGRYWIVEFKLRTRLSSAEQIARSRQTLWYAWAWRQQTGVEPTGVIVDERLNELGGPARHNKDGAVSRVQSCTPETYRAACAHVGSDPDESVSAQLDAKLWQQRERIFFRPAELEEAGWQLTTAGNLVGQLDLGVLYPIRNPSPARCPSCQFREICDTPHDGPLVDSLFTRAPPKRSRVLEEAA